LKESDLIIPLQISERAHYTKLSKKKTKRRRKL